MTRAVLLIVLLRLTAANVPEACATDLSYGLYVLGVPVADAVLSVDMALPRYRIGIRYHTVGLVSLLTSASMDTDAAGGFEAGIPQPFRYRSATSLHGQSRTLAMIWRDGSPVVTALTPPGDTEWEEVPPALRAHTMDPLSSIARLLSQTAVSGRCDGAVRTFDGRRLELFTVRTSGEEELSPSRHSTFSGRGLRCDFTEETIAGFRSGPGREDDRRVRRGTIWLSQILPGTQPLPVRASAETRWLGDAMIYLTTVSP